MTYKESFRLINTDLSRWDKNNYFWKRVKLLFFHKGTKFMFWWRLSKVGGIMNPFCRLMLRHYSTKYCIEIPMKVEIGESFKIGHAVAIVVNGNTKFGNNVTICQFLSIGSTIGKAAIVEDNVYIGPNVSLVNDVRIGEGSIIGAGACGDKKRPF